jgi:mono/diheme cytochrome c family protein
VKTERQPIHMFLDMDFQPRYGPQDVLPGAGDGRAMRPPVPGAVRYDSIEPGIDPDDDHFLRGYETDGNLEPLMAPATGDMPPEPRYFDGFPAALTIDRALIDRGRERYNIYCGVCHGQAGLGDGPVYQRIVMRTNLDPTAVQGFPAPRNLHQPSVLDMPTGKLFDRITRGVYADIQGRRTYTMWPYAAQISPRDRWAIVAYIRVMQQAQRFPIDQLPDDLRSQVEGAPTVEHPAVVPTARAPFTEEDLNDPELIAAGKALFENPAKNCFMCHQVEEDKPAVLGIPLQAPAYMGRFWGEKREVHLGPGGPLETVTFDVDYFYESIKEPMKRIAKGSLGGMTIPVAPTDEEINALAAYIRSLSQ